MNLLAIEAATLIEVILIFKEKRIAIFNFMTFLTASNTS